MKTLFRPFFVFIFLIIIAAWMRAQWKALFNLFGIEHTYINAVGYLILCFSVPIVVGFILTRKSSMNARGGKDKFSKVEPLIIRGSSILFILVIVFGFMSRVIGG